MVCVCACALSHSVMSDPLPCLLCLLHWQTDSLPLCPLGSPSNNVGLGSNRGWKERNPLKLPQIKEKWNIGKVTTWNTKVLNVVTFHGYLKILSNRSVSFHLSPWSLSPLFLGLLFLTHHLLLINDPTWLPATSSESTVPDPPTDGYLYFS